MEPETSDINPASLPLRDIHLPDAVSWWPPAPGWWIVALLICLTLAVLWRKFAAWRRRTQRAALAELRAIQKRFEKERNAREMLRSLSTLLRRVALATDARSAVAGLTGERWLEYLDGKLEDKPFSSGVGRCLRDGPYAKQPFANDVVPAELFDACERRFREIAA